jgi:hypothetical protein
MVVDRDMFISATFTDLPTLSLTKTGSGQVRIDDGPLQNLPIDIDFDEAKVIQVEAVASEDYAFDSWSGDVTGETNPQQIVMDSDKSVMVNFTENPTLSLVKTGAGRVRIDGGPAEDLPLDRVFDEGTSVEIEAVPDTGFAFLNWSGDLSGTTNPVTVEMDDDKTITMNFADSPLISMLKVFWKSSVGQVEFWALNHDGTLYTRNTIGVTYTFAEVEAGDINGDGTDDLIILTSTGLVEYWLLNFDGSVQSQDNMGYAPDNSFIVASDDMNGDGIVDLIFRDNLGMLWCWIINTDGTHQPKVKFGGPVSNNWIIEATGDIDGNGTSDLFWRENWTGWTAFWMLNPDGTRKAAGYIGNGPVAKSWQIEGAIDINGDHVPDLLWRNSIGQLAYWELNSDGSRNGNAGFIGGKVELCWRVEATGDIDGDGVTDLIWRNDTTGDVACWLIDPNEDNKRKATVLIGNNNTTWEIEAIGK